MPPQSPQGEEVVVSFGYTLETDVVFREFVPEEDEIPRLLKFDIYRPLMWTGEARPAVIYVHGGAHHRGGRMEPPFKLDGAVHSRPEDYARLLAPLGYVVFVVEYRLAMENPEPILKPGDQHLREDIGAYITPTLMAATTRARLAMGLEPLTDSEEDKMFMWKAAIAGAEDVKMALDFIIENANKFSIDPDRIAMGGHSAGAGITLNVGLGMKTPLAAIFPLSGPDIAFEHDEVAKFDSLPPTLMVYSQYDEHAQLEGLPYLIKLLRKARVRYELAWVPGFPHFYPHNAPALGDAGTRISVGDRIIGFLNKYLAKKNPRGS